MWLVQIVSSTGTIVRPGPPRPAAPTASARPRAAHPATRTSAAGGDCRARRPRPALPPLAVSASILQGSSLRALLVIQELLAVPRRSCRDDRIVARHVGRSVRCTPCSSSTSIPARNCSTVEALTLTVRLPMAHRPPGEASSDANTPMPQSSLLLHSWWIDESSRWIVQRLPWVSSAGRIHEGPVALLVVEVARRLAACTGPRREGGWCDRSIRSIRLAQSRFGLDVERGAARGGGRRARRRAPWPWRW